jgi:UDP-N-acetylmuramate: L-alanyl-gamma-D-glutamyl-meso-diaminopimelate ligase
MSNFHFIAIGGAIMHQLAIQLAQQGNNITGSDDVIFDPATTNLRNAGIYPKQLGWNVDNINADLDFVILGMHAKADNPELIRAKELEIPILSFPEFIAELSKNKKRIVIAGSHGKTTTTSMLMHSLKKANIDFDYLVGSKVKGFDLSVKITSDAPVIVIEGDEYLSSPLDRRSKFLHYKPHIAIITGIAWDHINVFPTFESYVLTFREFIHSIENNGHLIYFVHDETLQTLIRENKNINCIPYDLFSHKYENGKTLLIEEDKTYEVDFFGKHNISNLASVSEVVKLLDINRKQWLRSLNDYQIAANRLEKIFENREKQIILFKDFAHAPSKVIATVKAVREKYPDYRFIAIFELHTFSSFQPDFLPHYKDSLKKADFDAVYVSSKVMSQKGNDSLNDQFIQNCFGDNSLPIIHKTEELETFMNSYIQNKTVVLLMSSGNFDGFDFKNYTASLP